jgi:hypothetical protein
MPNNDEREVRNGAPDKPAKRRTPAARKATGTGDSASAARRPRARRRGRQRRTGADAARAKAAAPQRTAPRPVEVRPSPAARWLAIYLQDHWAGSTTGLELARRCAKENTRGPLAEFLKGFVKELEEDRAVLEQAMTAIGARANPLKQTGAWLGEKLGRLKLNGRLIRRSPLSRFVELEGLMLGVTGKVGMWKALRELAPFEPRLSEIPLDEALARGEAQRAKLEEFRLEAGRSLAVAK